MGLVDAWERAHSTLLACGLSVAGVKVSLAGLALLLHFALRRLDEFNSPVYCPFAHVVRTLHAPNILKERRCQPNCNLLPSCLAGDCEETGDLSCLPISAEQLGEHVEMQNDAGVRPATLAAVAGR